MRNLPINLLLLGAAALLTTRPAPAQGVRQQRVARINLMPDLPRPLQIIDYARLARRFDSTVYDFGARGRFWPLVWTDSSRQNFPQPVVGLYTAIGDVRQGPAHNQGRFHESLATMGAVLGATLVGIDKRHPPGPNYLGMLKNYFNRDTGWNIMLNNTGPAGGGPGADASHDWWYDVYPNVLFYAIYDRYRREPDFDLIARRVAEQFCAADPVLASNYAWSYFDYRRRVPVKTALCAQPDAAAGHAWVLYAAYQRFGNPRYLRAALRAMSALQAQPANPTYEVLMPFGAYLAARLNAEQGTRYDTGRLLAWAFDGNPACREGWGVLVGNWNGFDVSGLVGSTTDHGGYGFLMNTYDAAWPLVPLVRYDPRYAAAIGKWLLNAANAARLCYPQYAPAAHQTIPALAGAGRDVIAYEGLIRQSTYPRYAHLPGPVAQGDGPNWVPGLNPEESQLSVYGSAHVGIFGGLIRPTNVPGILRLNLLATDFFRGPAYPSCLYYNPYSTACTITLPAEPGAGAVDLYDAVAGRFVARRVAAAYGLTLAPRTAAVIVRAPAGGRVRYEGRKMLIDGVVVDYQHSSAHPK